MKHTRKILLGSLTLIGLQFAGTGCVGYVGDGGGAVVYGGGPWFHDDVWIDGGGRGSYGGDRRGNDGGRGGGVYIHPDNRRR